MTQKANPSEPVRNQTDYPEDKIELIDLLKVLWKWKLLIVGGTLALGLLSTIYGFNMTKIYRTEMVLRPGILTIRDNGKKEYIETSENIKALISAGTYNVEIIDHLKRNNKNKIPQTIHFGIEASRNANVLKISYLTANVEQGIETLNLLYNQLLDEYSNIVQHYRNGFQNKLSIAKSEIIKLKTAKQSHEMNLNSIKERIKQLDSEVVSINSNTNDLLKERAKFLKNSADESRILSAMLYSNTIQQNIALANTYKDEIYKYRIQKEAQTQKIHELENKIQKSLMEIDKLEFDIENIQNIQNIQPPSGTPNPIKPKIKLIVLLGIVAGFFLTIFLAFFLEYILKYRKMDVSSN